TWPNDSTNCTASARSASRAPVLMFDRNHFMTKHTSHRVAQASRCYNVTSPGWRGLVNWRGSRRDSNRMPLWLFRHDRNAGLKPLAQPGGGERAEQQQQADQPGEDRQHADALDHAGIAHLHAHPAVAMERAGGAHRHDARQVDAVAVDHALG